jgi:CysZ protein
MLRDFLRGADAVRRGFNLLRTVQSLRRHAFLPFLLNIVLFVIGIPMAIWFGSDWIGGLIPDFGWVAGPLRILAQLLVAIVIGISALFLFTAVGSAIAAPFNGLLAEGIERYRSQQSGAINPAENRDTPAGFVTSIVMAFARFGIFLVFYPFILALQLIPVAGPVLYAVCAFLYGTFVLSFDFTDPIFERHGVRFRQRIGFLLQHKAMYLGFGSVSVVLMFVPFANLLLMPVCVAGGTLLYLEQIERERDRIARP